MKVGHLVIATNRYMEFVGPLLDSARLHFLPGHEMTTFLFTNMPYAGAAVRVQQEHYPWPGMTLRRYEIFWKNRHLLAGMDYLYYTDADMLFVDKVGDEVMGGLVATIHPGMYNAPANVLPFENDTRSTAYVDLPQRKRYFAGGFNGGARDVFIDMARSICGAIKKDEAWGHVAQWHDESHLNKYLVEHPPTVVLDPSYCFPKDAVWAAQHPYRATMKLCPLEKNHAEYQV
jgi:histo-blood group ABO system transferase